MKNQVGFTLFEIIIVVAILSSLLILGLPRIKKNNTNIKTVAREIAVLTKEVRHLARLKNSTYRIVFQLQGPDSKEKDTYFVEAAAGTVLALSAEKQKILDAMPEDERPKSAFQKVDRPIKDEKELPSGLHFAQVETKLKKEPITSGVAFIHFTAEGLVEQSVIQVTDGKNLTWSLIINPLTGHADIVEKAVELNDVQAESN